MNIGISARNPELVVKEDFSERVDFVLIDTLYKVRGDTEKDRAEYDVFSWINMKDMAKVPGDVRKPAALGPEACSTLRFMP